MATFYLLTFIDVLFIYLFVCSLVKLDRNRVRHVGCIQEVGKFKIPVQIIPDPHSESVSFKWTAFSYTSVLKCVSIAPWQNAQWSEALIIQ